MESKEKCTSDEELKIMYNCITYNDRGPFVKKYYFLIEYITRDLLKKRNLKNQKNINMLIVRVFDRLFSKNYRLLKQYDKKKGALSTWIGVITTSTFFNEIKPPKPEPTDNSEEIDISELVIDEIENEERRLISRITIEKALNVLHPLHKKIFLLCYVDGYSSKEVSNIVKLGPGSIDNIKLKAKGILKEYLSNDLTKKKCTHQAKATLYRRNNK